MSPVPKASSSGWAKTAIRVRVLISVIQSFDLSAGRTLDRE